jgi:hypothetical protein
MHMQIQIFVRSNIIYSFYTFTYILFSIALQCGFLTYLCVTADEDHVAVETCSAD